MRDTGRRLFMAAVGIATVVVYGIGAYLSYRLLAVVWGSRPDPLTALTAIAVATVLVGYLSYLYGTARILGGLGAVEIPPARAPGLYERVDRLATRMAVDRPRVYVAALPTPNALSIGGATGGAIVFDRALFARLGPDEVEAVIAHELAHLESRDGLVQTLAYSAVESVAGLLAVALSPLLLLVVGVATGVAWIRGDPAGWSRGVVGRTYRAIESAVSLLLVALTLLTLAHSRRREFAADDRAVAVTGDPVALARALRTIQRAAEPQWGPLAPLYVHAEDDSLARLLATHPSMDDRIDRLLARAGRGHYENRNALSVY